MMIIIKLIERLKIFLSSRIYGNFNVFAQSNRNLKKKKKKRINATCSLIFFAKETQIHVRHSGHIERIVASRSLVEIIQ